VNDAYTHHGRDDANRPEEAVSSLSKPPAPGQDPEFDRDVLIGQRWLASRQIEAAPTATQYLNTIADVTGKIPNVCGLGLAAYIGGGRLGVGGSVDTSNGLQFASGVNLGHPGTGTTPAYGPGYTIAGGANGNVSYTAPVPDTPFSVSVGTHNGSPNAIQSVSANSRVGKLVNVSAFANIGTFAQCK
jgi:hypothetical protein